MFIFSKKREVGLKYIETLFNLVKLYDYKQENYIPDEDIIITEKEMIDAILDHRFYSHSTLNHVKIVDNDTIIHYFQYANSNDVLTIYVKNGIVINIDGNRWMIVIKAKRLESKYIKYEKYDTALCA